MTTAAILLYHRVAIAGDDPFQLCVSPNQFLTQMRYVREQCYPMTLQTLVRAASSGVLPERAVAVTFDDGYLDNLTDASPVLLECGIPATFFVTSDGLEGRNEFWWDTLTRLVFEARAVPALIELHVDSLKPVRVPMSSTSREAGLRALHDALRRLPYHSLTEGLRQIQEQLSSSCTQPRCRPMLSGELLELSAKPDHEIGVHTNHHLTLPCQPEAVQQQEMEDCARKLEDLLGKRPQSIAYPFGEADGSTAALARNLGFTAGVVVSERGVMNGSDPLRLPRIDVGSSELSFPALLSEAFSNPRPICR
jgi:peptidoglycan/xylan/chitin deacetylase (PgdA/CDA1 family)